MPGTRSALRSATNLGVLTVGENADGRLEVFAVADGDALWHLWQDPASATAWSTWDSLGTPGSGFLDDLAVAQNSDGRLEVFAVLNDDALWHIWQDPASPNYWSGWDSLGGEPDGAAAVARHLDGRLDAFAVARAASGPKPLYHRAQTAPNSDWGPNPDWQLTALTASTTALFRCSDGSVFARTQTELLRSTDQGDTWTPINLPPGAGKVAVDAADSNIIYAGGTGGLFKTTNQGSTWNLVYTDLPQTKVLAVAVSEANHLIVYAAVSPTGTDIDNLRSLDGGAIWTGIGGPFPSATCIWGVNLLFPHPTNQMHVFKASNCYAGRVVPSGDPLQLSTAQGSGWATILQQSTLFPSRMVGGKGIEPTRFYVTAHRGAAPGAGDSMPPRTVAPTGRSASTLPAAQRSSASSTSRIRLCGCMPPSPVGKRARRLTPASPGPSSDPAASAAPKRFSAAARICFWPAIRGCGGTRWRRGEGFRIVRFAVHMALHWVSRSAVAAKDLPRRSA